LPEVGAVQPEYGISVREMLSLPSFTAVRLVAGEAGLDRMVTNVNVMEVPDIVEWVKEGDILLTTAYAIRHDPEAQARLVPRLAVKGLAGLAIKPRRYIEEIPAVMREEADKHHFPLLELPPEVSFSDLIGPVLMEIIKKQNGFVRHSLETHREFMQVMLAGGGLTEVAVSLSRLVGNTVYIEDKKHRRSAFATVGWPAEEFPALLQAAPVKGEERPSLLGRIPGTQEPLAVINLDQDYVWVGERRLHRLTVPVVAGREVHGRVMVWDTGRPLAPGHLMHIERLTAVAALEILNYHAVTQVEQRYRSEFLDQLLTGERLDGEEVVARGRFYGWDLTRDHLVMLVDGPPAGRPAQVALSEPLAAAQQEVERVCRRLKLPAIVGQHRRRLVLMIHPEERVPDREWLLGIGRQVSQAVERHGALPGEVGIGRYHSGLSGLQQSFREAQRALEVGALLKGKDKVYLYSSLGIYRLLYLLLEDNPEAGLFLADTVLPIVQYDRERGTSLLETLEAYFRLDGNVRRVSEELFTHYNTVTYRLDRIQEITGLDLSKEEDRLSLQVGLKLHRLQFKNFMDKNCHWSTRAKGEALG